MHVSQWLRAHPWRRPLAVAFLAAVCFAAVQANWDHPFLRFSHPIPNQLFLLLALTLPWLAAGALLYLPNVWAKVVAIVLLLPALAYAAFLALFLPVTVLDTIRWGYDPGFQPIGTVVMGSYRVRIFRTNCGATCAYGIAVRQERHLVPGLLLVRELDGFYPAEDATYRVVGRDSLLINGRLYVLRPLP
jgi:hypothetical protein